MKRRRDGQQHRFACALLRGDLDRALDRRLVAADDHLAGRVVVGRLADFLVLGFLGDRTRLVDIQAEQRCHSPFADRNRLLHRAPSGAQEPCRVGKLERASDGQRRILPERMAGHEVRLFLEREPALVLEHPRRGDAYRHQRRLGVLGERQLVLRPLEHEPGQVLGKRFVDFLVDLPCLGVGLGQRLAHADRLRSLARKYECGAHADPSPDSIDRPS